MIPRVCQATYPEITACRVNHICEFWNDTDKSHIRRGPSSLIIRYATMVVVIPARKEGSYDGPRVLNTRATVRGESTHAWNCCISNPFREGWVSLGRRL